MRTKKKLLDHLDGYMGYDTDHQGRMAAVDRAQVEVLIDIRDLLAGRFGVERERMENLGKAVGEIKKNEMDGE